MGVCTRWSKIARMDWTRSTRSGNSWSQPVLVPWHNRYLKDSELQTLSIQGVTLEKVIFHSSTY